MQFVQFVVFYTDRIVLLAVCKYLLPFYISSKGMVTIYFHAVKIYFHALIIYFQSLIIYFQALKIILLLVKNGFVANKKKFCC